MFKIYIIIASLSIVFLRIIQEMLTSWLFCDILMTVIEMTIYERIKYLREKEGMSQQELADKVGFKTASAVNKIELGLRDINQTRIMAFAKALKTSPGYLMGWDTSSEYGLSPMPTMTRKPRLGRIACGEPILADENIEGYDDVPEFVHCDFTLLCEGDSMIGARIFDGDTVYVKLQESVENGEIAVVRIGEETTLKRFYRNSNTVTLMPENPLYKPFVFIDEEINNIRIIGKAVAFTSSLR